MPLLARRSPRRTDRAAHGRPPRPAGRASDRPGRRAAAVALWREHGELPDSERPLAVSDLNAGDGRLSRALRDAVYYAVDYRPFDAAPQAPDVQPLDLQGTLPPFVDVSFLLGCVEALPIRCQLADRLAWHAPWVVTSYAPPAGGLRAIAEREARGWQRHQSAGCLAEELAGAGFSRVAALAASPAEEVVLWRLRA